jgi:hypothetical protein
VEQGEVEGSKQMVVVKNRSLVLREYIDTAINVPENLEVVFHTLLRNLDRK